MVAAVGSLLFVLAFGFSIGVIVAMIAPRWQRIARLLAGHAEPAFQPLSQLVVAERRIAVRRRVVFSRRMPTARRAAA